MKSVFSSLSRFWCQAMHPSPMWPVNGQYRCPACMRTYRVPWEDSPFSAVAAESHKSSAAEGYRTGHQTVTAVPVIVK